MLPTFAKTELWRNLCDGIANEVGCTITCGSATFGKLPFFQELRNRTDDGPFAPVAGVHYFPFLIESAMLVCGPFKTNEPHTLSEELAEARDKLPPWQPHYADILRIALGNAALAAKEFAHAHEALTRARLLLEYTKAVSASKTLDSALHNTVQFLSHKFKLSNVLLSALGKTSRNFDTTPAGREVESRIAAQLRATNTPANIANVQTDFLLEGIKERDKLPVHALGLPLAHNRELIGHCIVTSEHAIPLDSIAEVLYELHTYLARLSEYEQAQASAVTDALTGLPNRAHLAKTAETFLKELNGRGPLSVVMIDADNFKKYNDTNGHPAGDAVLKTIAAVLAQHTPKNSLSARYGGEEFTLLLPGYTPQDAKAIAENIRLAVQTQCPLTISLGLITCMNSTASFERLLKEADDAMYQAKTFGKNKVVSKLMLDRNMGVIDG